MNTTSPGHISHSTYNSNGTFPVYEVETSGDDESNQMSLDMEMEDADVIHLQFRTIEDLKNGNFDKFLKHKFMVKELVCIVVQPAILFQVAELAHLD